MLDKFTIEKCSICGELEICRNFVSIAEKICKKCLGKNNVLHINDLGESKEINKNSNLLTKCR
jgi:hypothetical protein